MDAWRQDQAIFQKAKEAHLKDIEQLLETAKRHNATLDELIKLKSDFEATQKTINLANLYFGSFRCYSSDYKVVLALFYANLNVFNFWNCLYLKTIAK